MTKYNLYLPAQMLTKLRALADSTGLSVAEHIRAAISAYVAGK